MRKIWNAQIDLAGVADDTRAGEIEELRQRFDRVVRESVEKYKEKVESLDRVVKEHIEVIKQRDREVEALQRKIEEIKEQAEKDRMIYLDVGFHRSRNKKSSKSVGKKTGENDLNKNQANAKIEPRVPLVMIGYFDDEEKFHKTKIIQKFDQNYIEKQYLSELTKIFQTTERATLTDAMIEETKEKPKKLTFLILNKTQQFPEDNLKNFLVESQGFISIFGIPKKSYANPIVKGKSLKPHMQKSKKNKSQKFRARSIDQSSLGFGFANDYDEVKRKKSIGEESLGAGSIKEAQTAKYTVTEEREEDESGILKGTETNFKIIESLVYDEEDDMKKIKPEEKIFEDKGRRGSKSQKNIKRVLKTSARLPEIGAPTNIAKDLDNYDSMESDSSGSEKGATSKIGKNSRLGDELVIKLSTDKSFRTNQEIKEKKMFKKKGDNIKKSDKIKNTNLRTPKKEALHSEKSFVSDKSMVSNASDKPSGKPSDRPSDKPSDKSKNGSITEKPSDQPKTSNSSNKPKKKILQTDPKKSPKFQSSKDLKNSNFNENPLDVSLKEENKSIPYSELTSPQIHSTIHHLRTTLHDIFYNPERKQQLLKDTASIDRAADLGKLILNLFSPGYSQLRKDAPESLLTKESIGTQVNFDAEVGGSNFFSTIQIKTSNPSRTRERFNTETCEKADSNSANRKCTTKIPKKIVKNMVVVDEFVLGQVVRKAIFTHPGQKLIIVFSESLKNMDNLKASISLKSLMKIINSVHEEKVEMCKDNQNYKKFDASMVLYDMMTNKYGLKTVAENKFKQVVVASYVYKQKYIRIKNFARFLGIDGDYQAAEWNFYLACIESIEHSNLGKNIFNEDTSVDHFSSLVRCIQCIHAIFDGKLSVSAIESMCIMVEKMKNEENSMNSKKSNQKFVESANTDEFIDILLRYYIEFKEKTNLKYFSQYEKEDLFTEEEFNGLMAIMKKSDSEMMKKSFETYSIVKKDDETEQRDKVIKLRNILSIIWEYSLVDAKDLENTEV